MNHGLIQLQPFHPVSKSTPLGKREKKKEKRKKDETEGEGRWSSRPILTFSFSVPFFEEKKKRKGRRGAEEAI